MDVFYLAMPVFVPVYSFLVTVFVVMLLLIHTSCQSLQVPLLI
jgi:hypothetical protein